MTPSTTSAAIYTFQSGRTSNKRKWAQFWASTPQKWLFIRDGNSKKGEKVTSVRECDGTKIAKRRRTKWATTEMSNEQYLINQVRCCQMTSHTDISLPLTSLTHPSLPPMSFQILMKKSKKKDEDWHAIGSFYENDSVLWFWAIFSYNNWVFRERENKTDILL